MATSMTTLQIAHVSAALLLLATCTGLGIRLLLRARGLESAPERWMGAGLVLISALAFPLMSASGLGRETVAELRWVPLCVGLAALTAGIGCLATFTRKVFRPESRVGMAVAGGITLSIATIAVLLLHALADAPPDAVGGETLGKVGVLLRVPLLSVWAWTGAEALAEHARARRRLELGLTSAVVVNRYLLWGAFGAAELAMGSVGVLLQLAGRNPLNDPTAMALTAASGVVGSAFVALALCPPARYTSWVEARA